MFRTKKRALADVRLTQQVLSEACPLIEKRLGDPVYLRNFSHMGKQAFYNDEPGGDKEIRGIFSTGQVTGDHLANQFHVIPHVAAGGFGSFEIKNSKYIYSKRYGKINLFDWLWKGFGPYTQTSERKYYKIGPGEYKSMSRADKRRWKQGRVMYTENPMTFYYRYASKWFYSMHKRGGMDEGLVTKFHNYVFGAVEWGIEKAIENILESGKGNAAMKTIMDEVLRHERA